MENYNSKGSMTEYKINMDNMVYQKIMHWVDKAVGEVSGLGKLTLNKSTGLIEIRSAILLKQENTGTTTDIDAQSIAKAMYELRNEPGHLNFWWHSHVNMDVFWSGTDLDTIREIGNQGFVVATVFNKKREMLSCLYRKGDDFFPETFINEIPTSMIDYISGDLITQWNAEFEEKCVAKVYVPTYTASEYGGYQGDFGDDEPWYRRWNKKNESGHAVNDFDFGDNLATPNEQAKIYSITPQLKVLASEMVSCETYGQARRFLNMICARINKLKLSDKVSVELKQPYIQEFNKFFKQEKKNEAV